MKFFNLLSLELRKLLICNSTNFQFRLTMYPNNNNNDQWGSAFDQPAPSPYPPTAGAGAGPPAPYPPTAGAGAAPAPQYAPAPGKN